MEQELDVKAWMQCLPNPAGDMDQPLPPSGEGAAEPPSAEEIEPPGFIWLDVLCFRSRACVQEASVSPWHQFCPTAASTPIINVAPTAAQGEVGWSVFPSFLPHGP